MLFWMITGFIALMITFVLYCCVRVGARADRNWQEVIERQKQQK